MPVRARSLVFDLFGDHLRHRGGEVRLRALVTLMGWDLAGLAADYAALLARHRPRLAGYRAGAVTGADALRERTGLVHDYRRFPFRDPDLPAELLPPDWPGREAHELVLEAHGLLRRPAEEFVDGILGVTATGRPSGD